MSAIELSREHAYRLADDLDARRREDWEDKSAALGYDGTGETYARFARWSEALSDGLRRACRLEICEEADDDAEDWWQWLMSEFAGLVEVASDWTYLDWCADLMILKCRLMREAVELGWRVELDRAPDIWIEHPAQQLARESR